MFLLFSQVSSIPYILGGVYTPITIIGSSGHCACLRTCSSVDQKINEIIDQKIDQQLDQQIIDWKINHKIDYFLSLFLSHLAL